VIDAYGDRVVMEETLSEALAALFKETAPPAAPPRARRMRMPARPLPIMSAPSSD
jgi:anti-sigma factor RsiW